MNRHELLDVASISAAAILLHNSKFFADSLSGPSIGETVYRADPSLDTVRIGDVQHVTVDTPAGAFRGSYRVSQWNGPDAPTVVYHHGSGEDPFATGRFASNSFDRIFESGDTLSGNPNLIAIRAPFHERSSREYVNAMGSVSNFVGMLATSAAIFEGIHAHLREWGCEPLIASGTSLGGWVVNLHRAFYGGFDHYVPLLAGVNLPSTFTSSVYRKLVASHSPSERDVLVDKLDFQDAFVAVDEEDCSPLLARYDRIIEFDAERSSYAGMNVGVIDKGHVTGGLAIDRLRSHIDRSIAKCR